MVSHGIYTPFDKASRELPKIREFTTTIPARVGVEFGYVLNIKGARGRRLTFTIEHPPFPDKNGDMSPPFTGEVRVNSSDYSFFLGDTFWEPLSDKVGKWTLTAQLGGEVIAEKTFDVVPDEGDGA